MEDAAHQAAGVSRRSFLKGLSALGVLAALFVAFDAMSYGAARHVQLLLNGQALATWDLGPQSSQLQTASFAIPAGVTRLTLVSNSPAAALPKPSSSVRSSRRPNGLRARRRGSSGCRCGTMSRRTTGKSTLPSELRAHGWPEVREASRPGVAATWLMDPTGRFSQRPYYEPEALDRACERILEKHHGQTVLVVSHITPIKILLCRALGAPLLAMYRFYLGSACINEIQWHGNEYAAVRKVNDTSHLIWP